MERKLIGHPYSTYVFKQWYRLLTSGFIHADPMHLFFNLYSLRSFSPLVIAHLYFDDWGIVLSQLMLILLYIGGILSANIVSYYLHRSDRYYYHLGASAGVVAVMSSAILYEPMMGISIIFLPVGIPAVLFLPLYLTWSFIARNRRSSTGHLAHFIGAMYGIFFTLCIRYREILDFFQEWAA